MISREKAKAKHREDMRKLISGAASLRGVRMSARKVKFVADLVRRKPVAEALTMLSFQRKRAAEPLKQVIASATANAAERGSNPDLLVIETLQINGGTINKRFMPRAQGRASKIRKRTCHITVVLKEIGA